MTSSVTDEHLIRATLSFLIYLFMLGRSIASVMCFSGGVIHFLGSVGWEGRLSFIQSTFLNFCILQSSRTIREEFISAF